MTAADAATERITRQSCEASGGTFAFKEGYRQCMTVETYFESEGINPVEGPEETDQHYGKVHYLGEVEYMEVIQTTTIKRQKRHETPAVALSDSIPADWVQRRCYLTHSQGRDFADNSACESRGLFAG
jgi:hypothetical protein